MTWNDPGLPRASPDTLLECCRQTRGDSGQVCESPCQTCFFSSVNKCPMGFRSRLQDAHFSTFTWAILFTVCLGSLPCCKDLVMKQMVTFWLMSSFRYVDIPSLWWHLRYFLKRIVSFFQQNTPTTLCSYPHASQIRWCFSDYIRVVFLGLYIVSFLFQLTREHFSKRLAFGHDLQNFILLSWKVISGHGYVGLVDVQLVAVYCSTYSFTSSFMLSWDSVEPFRMNFLRSWELICASFLNSAVPRQSQALKICIQFFAQMFMVPSVVWKLLPRRSWTCTGPQFIYLFFSAVLVESFSYGRFSYGQKHTGQ